jgi:hypothetical protein
MTKAVEQASLHKRLILLYCTGMILVAGLSPILIALTRMSRYEKYISLILITAD